MATEFNEAGDKRGKLLGSGTGVYSMMEKCKKYCWSNENTILVVSNTNTVDSRWYVYERIKGGVNEK